MNEYQTPSLSSIHTLSGAYAVGALNDEERDVFEEHLPGCFDCRAEVAGLREAAAILAEAVAVPPPAALRHQVLTGIRTVRPLPPVTSTPVRHEQHEQTAEVVPMRRRFRLGTLAAAAAVLAVVGVGGVVADSLRDDQGTTQLTAADRVLASSDVKNVQVSMGDGASATVSRSARLGKAVLVSEGMRRLPEGKVYELWLRNAQGTMVPAGLLKGHGDHKQLFDGDAASATGAAISVEPARGSQSPTSDPVAVFDFSQA